METEVQERYILPDKDGTKTLIRNTFSFNSLPGCFEDSFQ